MTRVLPLEIQQMQPHPSGQEEHSGEPRRPLASTNSEDGAAEQTQQELALGRVSVKTRGCCSWCVTGLFPGYLGAWFADDGQVLIQPHRIDVYLRCPDAEATLVGATRGSGPNVKSTVRLVGPTNAVASVSEAWITDYIRRTC